MSRDGKYELNLRNTKIQIDDVVFVPAEELNSPKNTFFYEVQAGGIKSTGNRFLSKGLLSSKGDMHIKLNDVLTPADDWKITPQTDYNTIKNSLGLCFKLGELDKKNNYMDLLVDTCNDTDPMQQFFVINLDRYADHPGFDVPLTNYKDEPLYYGD